MEACTKFCANETPANCKHETMVCVGLTKRFQSLRSEIITFHLTNFIFNDIEMSNVVLILLILIALLMPHMVPNFFGQ